jgi:hypothetical protein
MNHFHAAGLSRLSGCPKTCRDLLKAGGQPLDNLDNPRLSGQPADNLRTTPKHALTCELDDWTTWTTPTGGSGQHPTGEPTA